MRADDIQIPEPCHEDWARMLPEERGWYCRSCRKSVHDLSTMTAKDATALLESGDDICVAYDVSEAGDVVFAPAPVVPISRLLRRARPLAAPAAAGLALALAACAPHGEDRGPAVDAPDHPTQVDAQPVIPDDEPPPEPPLIRVEVEEPTVTPPPVADEPCDTPEEPTAEPQRHFRGRRATPVKDRPRPKVKGKPARPL